jgi:hypothetical protein
VCDLYLEGIPSNGRYIVKSNIHQTSKMRASKQVAIQKIHRGYGVKDVLSEKSILLECVDSDCSDFDAVYNWLDEKQQYDGVEPTQISKWLEVRRTTDKGLGLFALRDIVFNVDTKVLPDELVGEVVRLDDDMFKTLYSEGYPSLIAGPALMYGVLSLCNHSCGSPLRFSYGTRSTFVHVKALYRGGIAKGEEILVNYDGDQRFNCKCEHCI